MVYLDELIEKYVNEKVLEERNRCLKILDMSNANDAHRYYIQNPYENNKKIAPKPQEPRGEFSCRKGTCTLKPKCKYDCWEWTLDF